MMEVFTIIGVIVVGGGVGVLLIWLAFNWVAFCNWKAGVDTTLKSAREANRLYGQPEGVYRTLFDRLQKLEKGSERLPAIGALFDRVEKLEASDKYTDESIAILRQHIANVEGKFEKLEKATIKRWDEHAARLDKLERVS